MYDQMFCIMSTQGEDTYEISWQILGIGNYIVLIYASLGLSIPMSLILLGERFFPRSLLFPNSGSEMSASASRLTYPFSRGHERHRNVRNLWQYHTGGSYWPSQAVS